MAEIAAAGISFRIPVVGELDRCIGTFGCGDEDKRVAALLVLESPLLDEA